jgi:hypothetical protein
MYNDINYDEIIKFIDEDIIKNKIIYNSRIVPKSIYGGTQPLPPNEKFNKYTKRDMVLEKILSDLGLENTKIDQKDTNLLLSTIFMQIGSALIILWKSDKSIEEKFKNTVSLISVVFNLNGNTDFEKYLVDFKKLSVRIQSFIGILNKTKQAANSLFRGGSLESESISNKLENLMSYVKTTIRKINENLNIQKNMNDIKNWLNTTDDSVPMPKIDMNAINNIVDDIIKKDVKELEPTYNYYFDKSSGKIIYNGENNFEEIITLISINDNYHIKSIEMITNKDKSTHYLVNKSDTKIDFITYIQGNPVQTGLVFAYMANTNKKVINDAKKYIYKIDDDGSIKIYLRNDNKEICKELPTITRAISQQINNDEKQGLEYIKNTCKEIFGYDEGLSKDSCAKHFYSILGRSAINMIQNLEKEIEERPDVYNLLLSANPGIQYEILKNLDWKSKKNSEDKLELINVEEWLNIKNNTEYKQYLKDKNKIKELLNKIVNRVNLERDLLEPSGQKEIIDKNIKRKIRIKNMNLSNEEKNRLKHISLMENFILSNKNYNFYGGSINANLQYENNNLAFNFFNDLDEKYKLLKKGFENINKKLSNTTDNHINTKIEQIKSLQKELELIYNKLLNYLKLIRTDKNAFTSNTYIDMNEIDNLIEQYDAHNNNKNKKIATITTVFGKLQVILEDYNNDVNLSGKAYTNSKNRQYYHNI